MPSSSSVRYNPLRHQDVHMDDVRPENPEINGSSSSRRSTFYTSAAILVGLAAVGTALYLKMSAVQNTPEEMQTHPSDEFYPRESICDVTHEMGSCIYNTATNTVTSALSGYQNACDKLQTCLSERQLYGISDGIQQTVKNVCNNVIIKVCNKLTGEPFTLYPNAYNTDIQSDDHDSFYACGIDSCTKFAGKSDHFPE